MEKKIVRSGLTLIGWNVVAEGLQAMQLNKVEGLDPASMIVTKKLSDTRWYWPGKVEAVYIGLNDGRVATTI